MTALTEEFKQKFQSYNQEQLNDTFVEACQNGHFDIVTYLLTSSDLTIHADIHAQEDQGFHMACLKSVFNIHKYLLSAPESDDNGHLKIVTYLLSFNGSQAIHFQDKLFNIDWAILNKQNEIIVAMMRNLKNNNIMEYIDCLPKIKSYSTKIHEQIENIAIDNYEGLSTETALLI